MLVLSALALWPFSGSPVVTTRGSAGRWRYEQVQDQFAGADGCRLAQGRMDVAKGLVRFSLGAKVDTSDALFKIDEAPARPWRAEIAGLVAGGASVQDDSLRNPSQGYVVLPLAQVIRARRVQIRAGATGRPVSFDVDSLADAVVTAAAKGCRVEEPAHNRQQGG